MKTLENAFSLDLLKQRIHSLKLDGFVVYTTVDFPLKGEATYGALVMSVDDHASILQFVNELHDDQSLGPHEYLSDDIIREDRRYVETDSAYAALTNSEELCSKLLDNALPDEYISLDNTSWYL
ncbi:MAG TPA: hypothetical protein VN778_01050 [Verrucomicrobiae bacterium]|nr:hypothetical protein [Verrucomicrobiae bacterium]